MEYKHFFRSIYLKSALLLLYSFQFNILSGQSCADLFDDKMLKIYHYELEGLIHDKHPIHMTLCLQNQNVKGSYTIVSSNIKIELEGILKNDSIYLAEYSQSTNLIGYIKGLFVSGQILGKLYNAKESYSYDFKAQLADHGNGLSNEKAQTFYFVSKQNKSQLLYYPSGKQMIKGIYFSKKHKETILFNGKKLNDTAQIYQLKNNDPSFNYHYLKLQNKNDDVEIGSVGNQEMYLKKEKSYEIKSINYFNRVAEYDINIPYFGKPKIDIKIKQFLQPVIDDFNDEAVQFGVKNDLNHKLPNQGVMQMKAWFEPTLFDYRFLCGHFYITKDLDGSSKVIPFIFDYKNTQIISLYELIVANKIDNTRTHQTPTQAIIQWSLTFNGCMGVTPFDRIYGSQTIVKSAKELNIKWKWWKRNYFKIKKYLK